MARGRTPSIKNKTLRQEYTRLRDIARKRLTAAKKNGINSQAIKERFTGFHKLRYITDNDAFKEELKALRRFVANRTETTKSGWDAVHKKVFNKLTEKGGYLHGTDFNEDDMKTFGVFMQLTNIAESESKILGSPAAVPIFADMFLNDRKDTKKRLREYAQLVYNEQGTEEGKEEVMDIIKKYSKEMGVRKPDAFTKKRNEKRAQSFKDAYKRRFDYEL